MSWARLAPAVGVLAVVGLSLTEDTRKRDATLTAPADAGYVSELAVDRDYRRRGLGSVMLRAAEELTMQVCPSPLV